MQPDLMLDTEAIRGWTYELWCAAGSCDEEARITADHLIEANLSGHDSHGLSVVPGYVRSLLSEQLQLNQRISLVTDTGSLLVVDGNRGMGQAIAMQTMALVAKSSRIGGAWRLGKPTVRGLVPSLDCAPPWGATNGRLTTLVKWIEAMPSRIACSAQWPTRPM